MDEEAEKIRRSVRLVKAKLISLTSRELGEQGHKILDKLREAPETEEGLRKTIKECHKLISLTIDEKKAKYLEQVSQKMLAEIKKAE